MRAEIAGAGFAGLTLATALRQRGWDVCVHEASDELRAFGAGIFIWDNGLRVLRAIGALDDVLNGAWAAPGYETRTDGKRLSFEAVNGGNRYRVLTMTRQHLYAAVLAAAQRSGVEIQTSSAAAGAEPEGVLVMADGRRLTADLVVGADGVGSRVRDSLDVERKRTKYQDGLTRVLVPRNSLKGGDYDNVIDFWAHHPRTLRILYTPCGADQLYMAMMAPLDDPEAAAVPVDPAVWIECFPDLAPVLNAIGQGGRYDLYETTRLAQWSKGKVALLGDAAHAMPPTLAQGAGCAMMNALSLACAVEGHPNIPDALVDWERNERWLTDHTQSRASELAASRALAQGMHWDDVGLKAALHIPTGTSAAPIVC